MNLTDVNDIYLSVTGTPNANLSPIKSPRNFGGKLIGRLGSMEGSAYLHRNSLMNSGLAEVNEVEEDLMKFRSSQKLIRRQTCIDPGQGPKKKSMFLGNTGRSTAIKGWGDINNINDGFMEVSDSGDSSFSSPDDTPSPLKLDNPHYPTKSDRSIESPVMKRKESENDIFRGQSECIISQVGYDFFS